MPGPPTLAHPDKHSGLQALPAISPWKGPPGHHPPCAPVGLCLRLGTCTSRLLACLAERGPRGPAATVAPSPWPRLGAVARGAGTGIWTGTGGWVGVPTGPSPGEEERAPRTHCSLSNPEKLGHVANDRAEAVVHVDVRAHPGGQLGSGIRAGEPAGRGRQPGPHLPQPPPRKGPMGVQGHLWSQRKTTP